MAEEVKKASASRKTSRSKKNEEDHKKPEAIKQKVEKKPEAIKQKVEKKPETIKDNSDQSLVGKTIECFLGSCLVEEIRSAGGNSSDSKHDIVKVRRESDNTIHILRRRQL